MIMKNLQNSLIVKGTNDVPLKAFHLSNFTEPKII